MVGRRRAAGADTCWRSGARAPGVFGAGEELQLGCIISSWLLPNRRGLKPCEVTWCDSMKAATLFCSLRGLGRNLSRVRGHCEQEQAGTVQGTCQTCFEASPCSAPAASWDRLGVQKLCEPPKCLFALSLGGCLALPASVAPLSSGRQAGSAAAAGIPGAEDFIACGRVQTSWSRFSGFPSQGSRQREWWED